MLRDYFQLHFIVLLWGFTAILGKLIGVPSTELVFYRTLVAALGLFIFLKFKKENILIDNSGVWQILFTGVLISFHWILFFESTRVSNVSVCLAGMATSSLWTSILEPIASGKKTKWYEVVLGIVVILGLYVVFHFEFKYLAGLMMAIFSAMLASIFSITNAKFVKKYNHFTITFYEMVGAFFATAILIPVYNYRVTKDFGFHSLPTTHDWVYIIILGLVCTVYAYSIAVELMKRISAFAINLTVNLEPVYGILLAVVFFDEHNTMTNGFYFGTLIILLAVLVYPALKKWDEKRLKNYEL
ncbi:MAG: DMT family transporter [Cytophagales bacterium]|nr:MAG: DMT family transporter [Cytophagales bacterium]